MTSLGKGQPQYSLSIQEQTIPEDDDQTVYSEVSSSDPQITFFIERFTELLTADMKMSTGQAQMPDIPASDLDRALKVFTSQLYEESENPFHWETSVSLHRKREYIKRSMAAQDQNKTCERSELASSEVTDDNERPSRPMFQKPPEMIHQWLYKQSPQEEEHTDVTPDLNDVQNDAAAIYQEEQYRDVTPAPSDIQNNTATIDQEDQLRKYKKFIQGSVAYQSLLCRMCQHHELSTEGRNRLLELNSTICDQVRMQQKKYMSRQRPSPLVELSFRVNWNPRHYLLFLDDEPLAENILDRVLCLTGSWEEAVATTVRDYVQQIWPVTGGAVLDLLKKMVLGTENEEHEVSLPGKRGEHIRARVNQTSHCSVTVTGGLQLVSEVAEQLGWLVTVLRSPPISLGSTVVPYYPHIVNINFQDSHMSGHGGIIRGTCSLLVDIDAEPRKDPSGRCWIPLFESASLVRGYPIPRRSLPNTGLEVPLQALSYFTRAQQVVQWNGRIIMKGFSRLLVATLAASGAIIWHLFDNRSPADRISYIDSRLDALIYDYENQLSLRSLEHKRHMIGWCADVTELCGSPMGNLQVSASSSDKAPGGVIIERLYIECGEYLIAGANMRFNAKRRPVRLQVESSYPRLVNWASLQAIVLHDVSDGRAWLVDGTSAFLHLVRVSLHRDAKNPVFEWKFDETKLKDKWNGCSGRTSAIKTLVNRENFNLPVCVKDLSSGKDETFGERAERMLHALEILVDAQAQVRAEDGIRVPLLARRGRGVEGFDVMDVIEQHGSIETRIHHLKSSGNGWLDILPDIKATVIFGSGLGDLIVPRESSHVCDSWKTVPTRQDCMAVSIETIRAIWQERPQGVDGKLQIGQLTRRFRWESPQHPFSACGCRASPGLDVGDHSDLVQYVVRQTSRQTYDSLDFTTLDPKGAVIFSVGQRKRLIKRPNRQPTPESRSVNEGTADDENSGTFPSATQSVGGSSTSRTKQSTTITDPPSPSSLSFHSSTRAVRCPTIADPPSVSSHSPSRSVPPPTTTVPTSSSQLPEDPAIRSPDSGEAAEEQMQKHSRFETLKQHLRKLARK